MKKQVHTFIRKAKPIAFLILTLIGTDFGIIRKAIE